MISRSHPLRQFLDSRDARRFETQVALTDSLSLAAQRTARKYRMRQPEVLDGLVTALVSCVQAMAPETEWGEVGAVLADVIQRRLTVTGVN